MSQIKPYGFCRFCGNGKTLKLEEGDKVYEQTDLDMLASEECNCEGAIHARKIQTDRKTTENYIENLVDKEEVATALKGFIDPLQNYKALSVAVKIDAKTKISLSINQNGALSVQRVDTMKTEYETE